MVKRNRNGQSRGQRKRAAKRAAAFNPDDVKSPEDLQRAAKLWCPSCEFKSDEPFQLAGHIFTTHGVLDPGVIHGLVSQAGEETMERMNTFLAQFGVEPETLQRAA